MNTQLVPAAAEASADPPDFKPGDVVNLVNSHGLAVVATNYRGKRLLVPNPTRGVVVGDLRENTAGTPLVDVRIAAGRHRGKVVSCYPGVVRLVARGDVPRRRRGLASNPLAAWKAS